VQKIDIRKLITAKKPQLIQKVPDFAKGPLFKVLQRAIRQREINEFIATNSDKYGAEFIDELFEVLDFNYYISSRDRARIPSEGRLIIVANHPLGALDGLSLLRAVLEVRTDAKIVANDLLMQLDNLSELFLPVDLYSVSSQKQNMINIKKTLQNEGVVILFPAGEVSRMSAKGISDGKWSKGAITLATQMNASVMPIHIEGRNSIPFYSLSLVKREIGTFMLANEIFTGKGKEIKFTAGDPIPAMAFHKSIKTSYHAKMLRKHLYDIGSGRRGIFKTEKTIIHPISRQAVKRELLLSDELGETRDGKKIYLVEYEGAKQVMREIARLRELTFRKVGEGTGYKSDSDKYDRYYKHIVLWDDKDLEIVGSYRLGICKDIVSKMGKSRLYNSELYEFSNRFDPLFEIGLEVGRSFVQQKYWGSAALDYLWQGIGVFLRANPQIRYLFGAVSISDNYPEDAKSLLITYYKKWYAGDTTLLKARNPYKMTLNSSSYSSQILDGKDYEEDFRKMKAALKNFGLSVPVLLRKYTDICHYGGVEYLGFNVDENFNHSVDCFINVDLHQIRKEFRDRYFTEQKSFAKRTKGRESVVLPRESETA